MRSLTKQEKKELEQHKLWLDTNTKQGKRLVWSYKDLRGADLYEANLWAAYLKRVNLEGANLYGVILWEANLEGANLTRANLEDADLEGANFEGADLEGANLEGAVVSFAIKILGNIYIIKSRNFSTTKRIREYHLATPMEIELYG